MVAENWYIILELEFDPNPVHDEEVIKNRIDEKWKFWNKNANDFSKGPEYRKYREMVNDIRNAMSNPDERKRLIKEACDITYGAIDKLIKMIGLKGEITSDELQNVANRQKISIDIVKNRALALGINIGDDNTSYYQQIYDMYYKTKPQKSFVFDRIKRDLNVFGVESLYEFLYSGTKMKYAYNLPSEILRLRASERKKNEFFRINSKSVSGSKLCVQCELAFKDENSKAEYDSYLEYISRKSILDEVKIISEISGKLSNEQSEQFVRQLTEIFKDRKHANEVFLAFCKIENIDIVNNYDFSNVLELCKLLENEIEHYKSTIERITQLIPSIRKNSLKKQKENESEEHTNTYGIDFGYTNSSISYVDGSGNAVVINNMEGTNTTPSVVNFASPTHVVVGHVAKENAVIDPQNSISLVKTLIGKSDFAINYNGVDKSPEEVSAYLFKKLASDASKMLDSEVKDVVITCPAYFGIVERTAIKNAGIIAGLNVLEIINEPTAAALYYGCSKVQDNKTILVYDLGGGTFDVTIMSISPDRIEVICYDGNHELGGKDWDEALMRYLAGEFMSQTFFDGEFDEYAQQNLRLKAEKAKQQLSTREEIPVMLDVAGLRAKIYVSRVKFNGITSSLLNETIVKTDAAIAVAKSKGYEVSEILLVGGSTYMPQVQEILKKKYGIEPKIIEPEVAVAKGAAIYANRLRRKLEAIEYTAPLVSVATKSYAVKVILNGETKCRNLIIKNTPLSYNEAITGKFIFKWCEDFNFIRRIETDTTNMEAVELEIYENDFKEEYFDVDEDYLLGFVQLYLSANLPIGTPIEITFSVNTEGILEITACELISGNKISAVLLCKGIMTCSNKL